MFGDNIWLEIVELIGYVAAAILGFFQGKRTERAKARRLS